MITEDYVSFEIAKLLKEKGFLKETDLRTIQNLSFYDNIGLVHNLNKYYDGLIQDKIDFVIAPTHQMAIKWLEKEKHIAIIPVISSILDNEKFLWDIKIVIAETGEKYSQGWVYEDRKSANEAAIKYCLENLI